MDLAKALKTAAAWADATADAASAARYVRVRGHEYDLGAPPVEGHRKNDKGEWERVVLFKAPLRRGFVSAADTAGRGIRIPLDIDVTFSGDVGLDIIGLKAALSAGAAKGITGLTISEHLAWLYTAQGPAGSCLACGGGHLPEPPTTRMPLLPFPEIETFPTLLHAASKDEVDRPTLCGVRINGRQAEAADETRIAIAKIETHNHLPGPVVIPTKLLKHLPKSKIPPAICEDGGRVFVLVGEELRWAQAQDRKYDLPPEPPYWGCEVIVPRERFANAVKFALQLSPNDVTELTFDGNELHVCAAADGAYTSHERIGLPVAQARSTRWVRGRLLHEAIVALKEHPSIAIRYQLHPAQPIQLAAGPFRETIQPLVFEQPEAKP